HRRQSEITNLQNCRFRSIRQQQIFWLEVSVANAVGVAVLNARKQLGKVRFCQRLLGADAVLDAIEQLAARDQLHHQEQSGLCVLYQLEDLVQLYNVEVASEVSHVVDLAADGLSRLQPLDELGQHAGDGEGNAIHAHLLSKLQRLLQTFLVA